MGADILTTLSGVFFISSEKYAPYYPWTMPGLNANKLLDEGFPTSQLVWGVGGGLLLLNLSNLYLASRDIME